MTMLPQHGILGKPASLIPTDDTKTYSLQSTLDETRYYLCSTLHQSPKVRSVILNTFTDGLHHNYDPDKVISVRKSTDLGLTYATKTTLYNPTDGTFQAQSLSAGYSNNGRFHALISCQDSSGTPGGNQELRYLYSDDDCTTMSSPVTITLPSTSLNAFRMHDKIIDLGNGVMLAPAYFVTDEGDATQSERYVVKTTDGGANWSWILVEGPTSTYINEGSLLAVTNDIVYMMCREDTSTPYPQFYCYKSLNQGATWTNLGIFGTTVNKAVADPPILRKFRADNGKWYAVMYFSDRGGSANDIYAIYGRLDNGVEGGMGLFNLSTLTLLRSDPTTYLHYGDFIHYNNNMNARGAWPREASSVALEDNEIIYFENLTTQYDSVFAKIDPITIWDKLYNTLFISSPRLLASNTTNDYGVVNGSNQVTTLKSIAPGPLNQDFTATAGGILLNSGAIDFDGTKALSHGTAAYFSPLHYSAGGAADVNNTLYAVVKFGNSSDPNAAYGLFGNSAGSFSNRGYCILYDDRVSQSRNNNLVLLVSKGSAGFIIEFTANNNLITPNAYFVLCVETDLSQSSNNDKVKVYINNVLQSTTVTAYSGSISSTNPIYVAQIGAIGNNTVIATMSLKDFAIQNAVDLASVRSNMNLALMGVNGI